VIKEFHHLAQQLYEHPKDPVRRNIGAPLTYQT
jgi:hypothetical protein